MKKEKRKKGRPKFEDDPHKKFMIEPYKSQYRYCSKRTLQNKYYEGVATCVLIEMDEAGEDTGPFWDKSRKKQYAPSLLCEIGRIENEEFMKIAFRQLIKEMKEQPERTVAEWRKDLRDYRKALKAE